jgi:hypothetical protein
MSRVQDTIERCASGRNKAFPIILDKVTKTFPKKNYKWCIGAAVHIQCMRESMGGWEYLQPSSLSYSLEKLGIDQVAVATIKADTIQSKYGRYIGYQNANRETKPL